LGGNPYPPSIGNGYGLKVRDGNIVFDSDEIVSDLIHEAEQYRKGSQEMKDGSSREMGTRQIQPRQD